MNTDLIPALDAAGMPGPPWLFHFLLVFTFFLHLIFMNLTLGGTLIAFIANLRGGGRSIDPNTVFAKRLMAVNTYAISLAITTGVAPLLFVQVLYQQYFYTGTILLGWIWFNMLVLLMIGYYAAYLHKKFRGPWLGVSAVTFFGIAMTHVAVHLIHVQPAKWAQFDVGPLSVLGDPTYWPRLLHFVLAAITFAALVAGWWAVRRARAGDDVELNTSIAKSAWRWALWATVLVVVDGFILLGVLPKPVLLGVMRGGLAILGPLDDLDSARDRAVDDVGSGVESGGEARPRLRDARGTDADHRGHVRHSASGAGALSRAGHLAVPGDCRSPVGEFHPLRSSVGVRARNGLLDGPPGRDQPGRGRRSCVALNVRRRATEASSYRGLRGYRAAHPRMSGRSSFNGE